MTTLEQYADQCAKELLAKRISDDVLLLAEFDDEDLEDILMELQS